MPNNLADIKFETLDLTPTISDVLNVCKQFSQLGWRIQAQLEYILNHGIEEAIGDGQISAETLPHIRHFLQFLCENPYFGDASEESLELLLLLDDCALQHPQFFITHQN